MRKLHKIVLSFICIFLTFGGIWFFSSQEKKRNIEVVEKIHKASTEKLTGLIISQYQTSRENWRVNLFKEKDLEKFQEAMSLADETPVSGHSGPIGEWTIQLQYESGFSLHFLATVHQYEKEHVFLTDNFYIQSKDGNWSRGMIGRARLPNIGKWLMTKAPKGQLKD